MADLKCYTDKMLKNPNTLRRKLFMQLVENEDKTYDYTGQCQI
jgi:hypothetical protein